MSVVREIIKVLPQQRISYYADSAHCPYGKKSPDYIIDRARFITDTLIADGADIIVIACNTATAAAIATLRKEYPQMPFIGTEPAVKPAAETTKTGVIGILATHGTLTGEKYHNTRDRYAGNVKTVEHVGEGFVELVEQGILEGPTAQMTVASSLRPLIEAGADKIVLGCTHYPFLIDTIRQVAKELAPDRQIEIIDPAPAIARHLCEVMATSGISAIDPHAGQHIIRSSDPSSQDAAEDLFRRITQ